MASGRSAASSLANILMRSRSPTSPPRLNAQVIGPTETLKLGTKDRHLFARVGIVVRERHQNADLPGLLSLLGACREWPCHGPARKHRNKIPSLHWSSHAVAIPKI